MFKKKFIYLLLLFILIIIIIIITTIITIKILIQYIYKNRKVRICTSQTKTECIVCHRIKSKKKPIRLSTVPNVISDCLLENNKIVIKKNQSLCINCNANIVQEFNSTQTISQSTIEKFKLETYSPLLNGHTLSHHWLNRLLNQYHGLKDISNNYQQHLEEHEQQIKELEKKITPNIKHRKLPFEVDDVKVYEKEKKDIPSESTKWRNRIVYQLCAESDCKELTGHDRTTIINQAMMCGLNSEYVFNARAFMYKYNARRYQGQIYGYSHSKVGQWIKDTLKTMNERYALPKLINGKSLHQQPWTWQMIHDRTPVWSYLLRELKKDDPNCPNVITCDSTYQYCKSPHTDQDSRKSLFNPYKCTYLVKVHIFSCINGQPLTAHYHPGDNHHA